MAKVIVVGAGISGLACAAQLKSLGHEVTVLEARDRIGGRMHTKDGLDLGAQWIHGNAPEFEAYVATLGLQSANTDFTSMELDGKALSATEFTKLSGDLVTAMALDMMLAPNRPLSQTVANACALGWFPGFSKWVVDLFATAAIDVEWADARKNVPARAAFDTTPWFWDPAWQSSGADNTAFPGGYNQITDALATGLDIRLNTVVDEIAYSNGVSVATNDGVFAADYVVVTLPLGVLKAGSVTFTPALPARKQGAIDRLAMGRLDKVILEFPAGTTLPASTVVGKYSADFDTCTIWVSISNVTGKPTMVGWLVGDATNKSDSEITSAALARWPELPTPAKVTITRWASDPYALGSYSSFDLDSQFGDRAILREPTGRVYWAGEHTMDTGFATVPGAWTSGIREAQRIDAL